MERRGFLKALGVLGMSSLIPKNALPIIEKIEEKTKPKGIGQEPYKFPLIDNYQYHKGFTNHITIQRKTYKVNAEAIINNIYHKH